MTLRTQSETFPLKMTLSDIVADLAKVKEEKDIGRDRILIFALKRFIKSLRQKIKKENPSLTPEDLLKKESDLLTLEEHHQLAIILLAVEEGVFNPTAANMCLHSLKSKFGSQTLGFFRKEFDKTKTIKFDRFAKVCRLHNSSPKPTAQPNGNKKDPDQGDYKHAQPANELKAPSVRLMPMRPRILDPRRLTARGKLKVDPQHRKKILAHVEHLVSIALSAGSGDTIADRLRKEDLKKILGEKPQYGVVYRLNEQKKNRNILGVSRRKTKFFDW